MMENDVFWKKEGRVVNYQVARVWSRADIPLARYPVHLPPGSPDRW